MDFKQWRNFNTTGEWTKEIDVRGFIQANYTPYEGNSDFLASPTEKTTKLWNKVLELYSDDEKKTYDFQVFVTCKEDTSEDSAYPIIGAKHKTSLSFKWTNNS